MSSGNADAIEREVQRRFVARLVAAGVRQGEITLQVLFMLPPEFVREYERLFYKALAEDSEAKPGAGGREGGKTKSVPSRLRGEPGSMHARDGGGGGKRYRTYWSIKDEEALKRKGSIDRKLLRLAKEIRRVVDDDDRPITCPGCQHELRQVWDLLGRNLRHCPWCGVRITWE